MLEFGCLLFSNTRVTSLTTYITILVADARVNYIASSFNFLIC